MFDCDYCEYTGKKKGDLSSHILTDHTDMVNEKLDEAKEEMGTGPFDVEPGAWDGRDGVEP